MTSARLGTLEFGSGPVARMLRGALGVVMLLALVTAHVLAVALVFLVIGWFVKWWAEKQRQPSSAHGV